MPVHVASCYLDSHLSPRRQWLATELVHSITPVNVAHQRSTLHFCLNPATKNRAFRPCVRIKHCSYKNGKILDELGRHELLSLNWLWSIFRKTDILLRSSTILVDHIISVQRRQQLCKWLLWPRTSPDCSGLNWALGGLWSQAWSSIRPSTALAPSQASVCTCIWIETRQRCPPFPPSSPPVPHRTMRIC